MNHTYCSILILTVEHQNYYNTFQQLQTNETCLSDGCFYACFANSNKRKFNKIFIYIYIFKYMYSTVFYFAQSFPPLFSFPVSYTSFSHGVVYLISPGSSGYPCFPLIGIHTDILFIHLLWLALLSCTCHILFLLLMLVVFLRSFFSRFQLLCNIFTAIPFLS